jgi:hypothetical protein
MATVLAADSYTVDHEEAAFHGAIAGARLKPGPRLV